MAAIFDAKDEASPSAHSAAHTALLFLDLQNICVKICGEEGEKAIAVAKILRDWAMSKGIMIIHSVINPKDNIPSHTKNRTQLRARLDDWTKDGTAAEEAPAIAFSGAPREFLVYKPPGLVSGMKSVGITELLSRENIESLVVAGLSTSGAVLRTTTAATDDGFVVTVIRDACADNKIALHEALLDTVLTGRAHVATSSEFMEQWNKIA